MPTSALLLVMIEGEPETNAGVWLTLLAPGLCPIAALKNFAIPDGLATCSKYNMPLYDAYIH